MPVDLNKIKSKLDQYTKKNQPKQPINDQSRLKLEAPGTYTIRLVPYKECTEYPFLQLKIYYNLGKSQILSPVSYGQKDPIYEKAMVLKSTKVKEDWQMSKKIQPKLRIFALAIVRGEQDKGPRWWDFSPTVHQELLRFMNDPEYGDISDPYEGTDIVVQRLTKEQTGTDYGDTKVRLKRNSSPLSTNQKQIQNWLNTQPDIFTSYKKHTYEQLEQIWQNYMTASQTKSEDIVEQSSSEDEVLSVIDKFQSKMNKKK